MTTPTTRRLLAHEDTGGAGRLVVMLPSAGGLRSEYRFVAGPVASAGFRVVTADLPGHGDSPPAACYAVGPTAAALVDLIHHLDAGPAVVVGASFAPPAAVWAAAEHPDLIDGIVAISPHLDDGYSSSAKGRLLRAATNWLLLRGPWAAAVWAKLYAGWHKASPPEDLDAEVQRLRAMLADPTSRRAVRESLIANRDGVSERVDRLDVPTLTVFGSADDHFPDPVAEAATAARRLRGEQLVVETAGHYPHVEQPALVADAIIAFLRGLR